MITHLVSPRELDAAEVVIEGDGYRHLFRARRLASGARLRLVDGGGRARWAEVREIDRRRAVLAMGGDAPRHEPAFALQLVVAPLRPERASWLVEKATELGVATIRFVRTARTPRELQEGSLDRLRRVAAAAVVQCHRATLPDVTGVHPWEELEGLLRGQHDRWFLDPEAPPVPTLAATGITGTVLVGPEGGWAPEEQKQLARWATALGLGDRVLRVETAALVAAARLLT